MVFRAPRASVGQRNIFRVWEARDKAIDKVEDEQAELFNASEFLKDDEGDLLRSRLDSFDESFSQKIEDADTVREVNAVENEGVRKLDRLEDEVQSFVMKKEGKFIPAVENKRPVMIEAPFEKEEPETISERQAFREDSDKAMVDTKKKKPVEGIFSRVGRAIKERVTGRVSKEELERIKKESVKIKKPKSDMDVVMGDERKAMETVRKDTMAQTSIMR